MISVAITIWKIVTKRQDIATAAAVITNRQYFLGKHAHLATGISRVRYFKNLINLRFTEVLVPTA